MGFDSLFSRRVCARPIALSAPLVRPEDIRPARRLIVANDVARRSRRTCPRAISFGFVRFRPPSSRLRRTRARSTGTPRKIRHREAALAAIRCLRLRRGGALGLAASLRSALALTCLTEIQIFLSSVGHDGPDRSDGIAAGVAAAVGADARVAGPGIEEGAAEGVTQGDMLLRMALRIVEPLLGGDDDDGDDTFNSRGVPGGVGRPRDNRHLILPLEVLPALFAASARLDRGRVGGASDAALDALLPRRGEGRRRRRRRARPDMVLPLLTLSHDVAAHAGPRHRAELRRLVFESVGLPPPSAARADGAARPRRVPEGDYPGLARGVLSYVAAFADGGVGEGGGGGGGSGGGEEARLREHELPDAPDGPDGDRAPSGASPPPTWEEVLLRVYRASAASSRASTMSTVESVLKSSLRNASARVLDHILRSVGSIRSRGAAPPWVCANVLLLVLDARGSGARAVRALIADAVGRGRGRARGRGGGGGGGGGAAAGDGADVADSALRALVGLAFPDADGGGAGGRGRRARGHAKGGDDDDDAGAGAGGVSSKCAALVRSSLFCGRDPSPRGDGRSRGGEGQHASERAQMWADAASSLLDAERLGAGDDAAASERGAALATAALATVFRDVPPSRAGLVRVISANLAGGGDTGSAPREAEWRRRRRYCALASVLARDAGDRGGGRTGDEDGEDARDALVPLSDLLASAEPIPVDVAVGLAWALCVLPSARGSILSAARKRLRPPLGDGTGYRPHGAGAFGGGADDGTCAGGGDARLALECLCSLLLRRPTDDESESAPPDRCGAEAISVLSDSIVANRPALPSEARAGLYRRLAALARAGRLGLWTLRRLLRAGVVRLLRYFALRPARRGGAADADERAGPGGDGRAAAVAGWELLFLPERCVVARESSGSDGGEAGMRSSLREDLAQLFRLLLSLIRAAERDGSEECSAGVGHDSALSNDRLSDDGSMDSIGDNGGGGRPISLNMKEQLIRILSRCGAGTTKTAEDYSPWFGPKLHAIDVESDAFPSRLVQLCLEAVLCYLLGTADAPTENMDEGTEVDTTELRDCLGLQSKFIDSERQSFSLQTTVGRDRGASYQSFVPQWVKTFSVVALDPPSFRPKAKISHLCQSFNCTLCDLMVELLLCPEWECGECGGDTEGQRRQLQSSYPVNVLLRLKRVNKKQDICFGSTREMKYMLGTASAFFDTSSQIFCSLLSSQTQGDNVINKMDLLIQAVLDYCGLIETSFSNDTVRAKSRSVWTPLDFNKTLCIVKSLWSLYQSMAGENASCRFIQFLEGKCVGRQLLSDTKNEDKANSLRSITSVEHVDDFVRTLRLKVLSALNCILEHYSNTPASQAPSMPQPIGGAELFCTPLSKADTNEMLPENSRQHYAFWLEVTKTLCNDLSAGLQGDSGGVTPTMYQVFLHTINSCINNSTASVKDVTSNITIEEAVSTCQASSAMLWNILCRFSLKQASLFKMTLMLSVWRLPSLCHQSEVAAMFMSSEPDGTISKTTTPLVLALMIIDQCQTWTAQNESNDTEEASLFNGQSEDGGNVASVNDCAPEPCKHANDSVSHDEENSQLPGKLVNCGRVRIRSADCWSWAYSSSLLAAERIWMDSHRVLKQGVACSEGFGSSLSEVPQGMIIHYATKRIYVLHTILELVTSLLIETNEANESVDTAQRTCPSSTKLPSAVKFRLSSCLERIALTLKHSTRLLMKGITDTASEAVSNVEFVEAAACFLAWMHPRSSPIDFASRTRRWYQIESRNNRTRLLPGDQRSKTDDPILGRLRKASVRVEEMVTMLQKMNAELSNKDNKSSEECIKILDALMVSAFRSSCEGSGKNLQREPSFFSYVKTQLNMAFSKESELGSFGAAQFMKNNAGLERRLRMARHRVPRSRNELVDQWLSLDAKTGEGGTHNDAYVDLENFLVKG